MVNLDKIEQYHCLESFISCAILIIFSELGDKTFFITIILSAKFKKMNVLGGAILALSTMTILSVAMGIVFNHLISKEAIKWISFGVYAVCGCFVLYESVKMDNANHKNITYHEANDEIARLENCVI